MGSRAPAAPPAFVPAPPPGSQPLAFQWPPGRFVLLRRPVWGWDGMGAGHHKSTCCVCARLGRPCGCGWDGGWRKIHCCCSGSQARAQTKAEEGRACSTPASFLPPLETLSGFQGAGAQATPSDCRGLRSHTRAGPAEPLKDECPRVGAGIVMLGWFCERLSDRFLHPIEEGLLAERPLEETDHPQRWIALFLGTEP